MTINLTILVWFIGVMLIWFGYFYINDTHELGLWRTLLSVMASLVLFFLIIVPMVKWAFKIGGGN